MIDLGLTHIALPITNADASIAFYSKYARMRVVHRRTDSTTGTDVVWMSDGTRPFVIVLIEVPEVDVVLAPFAHLGVGCESRAEVDRLSAEARAEGILVLEPEEADYSVGYFAFIRDPDGHTLEIAYGQEVALTVERATQ